MNKVQHIWAAPVPAAQPKKIFCPKNALGHVSDYRGLASPEFWASFPVNRVRIGTPLIDVQKLRMLVGATGYQNVALEQVFLDLEVGASIGCTGVGRSPSVSNNAPSAFEYPGQVTDAIATWVKKGFVFGPVDAEAVPGSAKVNGIMCRPKPSGAVRIILNMSAPEGMSVNDGINLQMFPAVMSSTSKWLAVLNRAGRDCQIMKLDWADAYKHFHVVGSDVDLQWFSWLGRYFAELCLIFGTSSSVGIYDRGAKVVLGLVLHISKFPSNMVCQYLDDVCAAAPSGCSSLSRFESVYRSVADQIGVQLAPTDDPDKAFSPCTAGTVLGVAYDTVAWTWSIPPEKLGRLCGEIRTALAASHIRQSEVWSVVGRILHYCPLVPTGQFNINHLIKANHVSVEKQFMVEIWPALRRQLWFWLTLIQVSSGESTIPDPDFKFPPWTLEVYTDAAGGSLESVGRGSGVVCGSWWAVLPWSPKINMGVKAADGKKLGRKLSALELVGPLIAVSAGHAWCRGRPVRIWVDNSGSVNIWKKGYSSSCDLCTTLVKAISCVAAALGCRLTIEKITRCSSPGAVMADALSKADFLLFRRTALEAQWPLMVAPAAIPASVLCWVANPVPDEDLGSVILADLHLLGVPLLGFPV